MSATEPTLLPPGSACQEKTSHLLDAHQAAALLNVPHTWVLAEARADRLPHVRLGRYVRFEAAALDAWWRERARGPWRGNGTAARRARTGSNPVAQGREAA